MEKNHPIHLGFLLLDSSTICAKDYCKDSDTPTHSIKPNEMFHCEGRDGPLCVLLWRKRERPPSLGGSLEGTEEESNMPFLISQKPSFLSPHSWGLLTSPSLQQTPLPHVPSQCPQAWMCLMMTPPSPPGEVRGLEGKHKHAITLAFSVSESLHTRSAGSLRLNFFTLWILSGKEVCLLRCQPF